MSDEAVARTSPPDSRRRWVLRAGTVGLFVGGALALGVGTAAMASAAGPHAKPAKNTAPAKTSPSTGTTTVSSLGATCSENSFFSGQPAAGSTVNVGDSVKVLYFDETDINAGGQGKNGAQALPPTLLVDGKPTTVLTPGSLFAKGATSDGFTGLDKYNRVLTATVPSGAKTVGIIAFDGDQNKTGGDCGVISWTVATPPPPPPAPAHVAADILLCSSGSPVGGGLISETSGATGITAAQPIPSTSVAAGTYTFHAEAPNGFALVTCGQSSSNDKSVDVGPGESKVVHFYVKAVTNAPDLAIIKVASTPKVRVGNTLVYRLVVSNVGLGATTGTVKVTDSVPAGLAVTAVSGGSNWDCSLTGNDVSCNWLGADIQPGQSVTPIKVTTTVLSTAPTVLVNTGVVKTPGDINPGNDESTVTTPVTRVLGVKITTTKPAALPFTGNNTRPLVELALLLLVVGLGLTLAGTSRRRASVLTE